MQIIEGELHDPLVATFQTLEVARLNDALKECGVSDSELRRRVCETYFFDAGYFLDSCWFEEEESRVRPGVYFAEIDKANAPTGRVFMPDPEVGTMWHEYAGGAAEWLFDQHSEDASEIQVGDELA